MRQDQRGDAIPAQMTNMQVGQNSVFIDGFCRQFTQKSALYRLPFGLDAESWSAGQRNLFYSYKMLHHSKYYSPDNNGHQVREFLEWWSILYE